MALPIVGSSQINWINDLETGKSLAKLSGKLIIVDFWAIWCGPCKKMDRELWRSSEVQDLIQKVIPVKIDVDTYREVARGYNANTIPKVLLLDSSGDVIWQHTGYLREEPYVKALELVPDDVHGLNVRLEELEKSPDDPVALFHIGLAYQELGTVIDGNLMYNFISRSNHYLKKSLKKSSEKTFSAAV